MNNLSTLHINLTISNMPNALQKRLQNNLKILILQIALDSLLRAKLDPTFMKIRVSKLEFVVSYQRLVDEVYHLAIDTGKDLFEVGSNEEQLADHFEEVFLNFFGHVEVETEVELPEAACASMERSKGVPPKI